MRRTSSHPGLLLSGLGLLLTSGLGAQEQDAAALAKVEALEQDFKDTRAAWMESYRAATDNKERQKLASQYPQPRKWADRFLAAATASPATDAGLKAAGWIVSNSAASGAKLEKALSILVTHHVNRAELATIGAGLTYNPSLAVNRFLRAVETQTENAEVRGMTTFYRAEATRRQGDLARQLRAADDKAKEAYVKTYGQETIDVLTGADPGQFAKDAEALYARILENDDYDALTYRNRPLKGFVKSTLFELRNLSIGKVAPEIDGEDIDGNPMKLSDYRGKVVVLDFWGDW